MNLALLIYQPCTQFMKIHILLLLQIDDEIAVCLREAVEDNGEFDVVSNFVPMAASSDIFAFTAGK